MIKAGAQRLAAELGVMLVAPDTSPRRAEWPGDDASWDFGLGAGFYVTSTQAPCRRTTGCMATSRGTAGRRRAILPRIRAGKHLRHSMGRPRRPGVRAAQSPRSTGRSSAFAPIAAPIVAPGDARRSWLPRWRRIGLARVRRPACWWRSVRLTRRSRGSGHGGQVPRGAAEPEVFAEACGARPAFELRMHGATTTAITSSRASWKTTCAGTPAAERLTRPPRDHRDASSICAIFW